MYRGEIAKELISAETTPDTVLFWSTGGGSSGDAEEPPIGPETPATSGSTQVAS